MTSSSSSWLTLAGACQLLGVTPSTVRHWADVGRLRAFRTPGGHRRFSREDVLALISSSTDRHLGDTASTDLEVVALRRIRSRLHSKKSSYLRWQEAFDEKSRDRLRLFGRRLLTLLSSYLSGRKKRGDVLAEAHLIGREHGEEIALKGLSFKELVEAFLFFRRSLLDAAGQPEHTSSQWQHLAALADEVLIAMAESYESTLLGLGRAGPGRMSGAGE